MNYTQAAYTRALQQYTRLGTQTEIESASQHRLIQMLMEGALSRIIRAKSCIGTRDVEKKGEFIGLAISIIGGLRDSLDHKADAALAANLDRLYEYMSIRLLEANIKNDVAMLDEVYGLLLEVKTAWDAIAVPGQAVNAANIDGLHKQAV